MKRELKPDDFASNPGNPIRPIYSEKVDEKGVTTIVQVGEENTDALIQAAAESTDIATIVAYYNQTGDESVLHRYIPQYGDFTKLPKTLAEFLQLRIDSEHFFEALPSEVKQKFNNSADEFFAQAGNEDWYEKIKPILPDEKPYPDPEVKGVEE